MVKNIEDAFEIYEDYIKSLGDKDSMAVAIKYDKDCVNAPIVSAKGSGILARRMIDLAKSHDIPIVNDEGSVNELMRIKIGSEIPYCMYEAISIILSHIYVLSKK